MRSLNFLICASALFAQTLFAQVGEVEKRIAANPEDLSARSTLLQLYWNTASRGAPGRTTEQVRAWRRENILWLIRNHPEAILFLNPESRIDPQAGPLADPQGFVEAAALWKEAAAKPDASVEVLAHAAYFLAVNERLAAFAILDPAWKTHPRDPLLAKVRGTLDALEILGVKGAIGPNQYVLDSVLATSPRASQARAELESSEIAGLVGAAGEILSQLIDARDTSGLDDAFLLAERLLKRAAQIEPTNPSWNGTLSSYYLARGGRSRDPRERARIFRDALVVATLPSQRMNLLGLIAEAEYDTGDVAAAVKVANQILQEPVPQTSVWGYWDAVHKANSLLGRAAVQRGDLDAAKKYLLASARVQSTPVLSSFGPGMKLAQNLFDAGQRDTVLEYLELTRKFWTHDFGRLDGLIRSVKTNPAAMLLSPSERGPALVAGDHPPAFTLKDLTGKEWSLADLAGKVVVLDFWATWCSPCREEMPALTKVAKDLAPRGVVILGIDAEEPEQTLRAWVAQNPTGFPVLLGDTPTIRGYHVTVYPTLVVVDRSGVIADSTVGRLSESAVLS